MELAAELLGYVFDVLLAALAVVSFVQWRRRGGDATKWFMLTFVILTIVVLISLVVAEDRDGIFFDVLRRIELAVVVAVPYSLYRFTGSFERSSRRAEALALGAAAILVAWSLFGPELPGEDEPRTTASNVFVFAFLAYWSVLSLVAAARLWRAGRGQPSVARRRMRLLSLGALGLTAALVIAGAAEDDETATALFTQSIALVSVALFFLGFSPPAWLRVIWRRPEQSSLRAAISELMSARTEDELSGILLPHVGAIVGGRAVAIVDERGETIASHGPRPAIEELLSRAAVQQGEGLFEDLIVLRYPVGSLVVLASRYTPFFGPDEVELVRSLGALAEIALERVRLESQVSAALENEREARIALEAANTELESFVYTVSHDLNSPLISVVGYLEYLRSDYGHLLPDEGKFFIERMGVSVEYMKALIRDLLELSRVGRAQTEPDEVDLQGLIGKISGEVSAAFPGLRVESHDLPKLWMNPVRAQQLFVNLIQNAARYAERPDVNVTISASALSANGETAEFSVRDNGPGIPEDARDRVFGVFERLAGPQSADGTGIGLAVCKRIVESVGGHIYVAPSDDGTDMRLSLPLAGQSSHVEDRTEGLVGSE